MVIFKENRKFFEFAIGYIFVGIGQRLMGVGLLKPWSENAPVLLWLGLVGLSFVWDWIIFHWKISHLVSKGVQSGATSSESCWSSISS